MNVTNNFAYVNAMKRLFIPGMRIKLMKMNDSSGVPDGTIGTVDFVDDAGQIQMKWDNGSTLALIYGVDVFQIIPDDCGTKYVIREIFDNKKVYFNHIENQQLWGTDFDVRHCDKSIKGATLYDCIEDAEEACASIENSSFKIYPVCPRCHNEYEEHCAISRTDNKTEICEKCGLTEALWDFFEYEKKAKVSDPLYQFNDSLEKQKKTTNS